MKRELGTVFLHFSKFYQENLSTDLLNLKSWYENQNLFRCVCLSFPTFFWKQIQENEIIFFWLKRLIQDGSFLYFPNTYSGENHQSLTREEAYVDLAWAMTNPHKTGYRDLFASEPVGLYISNRDLYRTKMQNLYYEYKETLLLEGLRQDKKETYLLYRQGNQKKAIPLWRSGWWGVVKRVLSFFSPLPREHSLLYWSSLDKKALFPFLEALPKYFFKETKLWENKRLAAGYFVNLRPICAEADLFIRSHNFSRQSLRPSSPLEEKIADNLRSISPVPLVPREVLKGDPQQILENETSFTSGHLRLSFEKGQFLGWRHKQKNLPKLPFAKSYSIAKNMRESEYHSSSLKQGNLSGIRQIVFCAMGTSSSIDYFPLEGEDAFLINANFTWNARALKTRQVILAPLELPLYRLEKDSLLKISVLSSEGDNYERLIPDDEVSEILWGESFFFHHFASPLMLSFPDKNFKIKFPLALKTKKIKGYYYLFLNLGGFYSRLNLDQKMSTHESFSLIINQPSKMPFLPLKISNSIKKEILPCEIWVENS